MNGYRIGKKSSYENGRSSEFTINPIYAMFDTGTSLTYLPSSNWNYLIFLAIGPSIIAGLLRGKRFVIKNGLYYVPCDIRLY